MKTALNAVVYALWLIKEIFVAGFTLALESFKPRNNYHPVVLRYPHPRRPRPFGQAVAVGPAVVGHRRHA